jgi:hypothetical protein
MSVELPPEVNKRKIANGGFHPKHYRVRLA